MFKDVKQGDYIKTPVTEIELFNSAAPKLETIFHPRDLNRLLRYLSACDLVTKSSKMKKLPDAGSHIQQPSSASIPIHHLEST